MRKILCKKLNYIRNVFSKPSDTLKSLDSIITSLNVPEIHISPEEAKILQFFIRFQKISKVIEIGTHVGYSAICMAEALPKDGSIFTIEKDKVRANIARNNFISYNYHNIKLYEGDALEILPDLEKFGPFDMLFIDANKSKYIDYFHWGEKNIKKNGLIVADNVLLFGSVYQNSKSQQQNLSKKTIENMQLFNELINDQQKFSTILIPTDEGLSISIKMF